MLNFTDPFFSTRVLGFESLLIDFKLYQNLLQDRHTRPTILGEKEMIFL